MGTCISTSRPIPSSWTTQRPRRALGVTASSYLHLGDAVPMFASRREPRVEVVRRGAAMSSAASPPSPRVPLWLMDTGCGYDLISRDHVSRFPTGDQASELDISLDTANGSVPVEHEVSFRVPELAENVSAIVLQSTPPVLSIGRRCMEQGYRFEWPPFPGALHGHPWRKACALGRRQLRALFGIWDQSSPCCCWR